MLNCYPDYYPEFHCTADKCRHNCCMGWEIDIDKASLKKYRAVRGEMGKRLKRSISRGREPHFVLEDGERCPFLNGRGLCELMLFGGEAMLCNICADHPRFRSFFEGRTEIGLGLCCEEAARIIITRSEPFSILGAGNDEAPDALIVFREKLLDAARDRSLPVRQREENVLALAGAVLPELTYSKWTKLFLSLERMDEAWTKKLKALEQTEKADEAKFMSYMSGRETEYEQLLCYFLFRHIPAALDDGNIPGKAAFAVLSTRLLRSLGAAEYAETGSFGVAEQIELCRLYSAEIEYSDENTQALYSALS